MQWSHSSNIIESVSDEREHFELHYIFESKFLFSNKVKFVCLLSMKERTQCVGPHLMNIYRMSTFSRKFVAKAMTKPIDTLLSYAQLPVPFRCSSVIMFFITDMILIWDKHDGKGGKKKQITSSSTCIVRAFKSVSCSIRKFLFYAICTFTHILLNCSATYHMGQ